MSLDTLVEQVVADLDGAVSAHVGKCVVQVAREALRDGATPDLPRLTDTVTAALRHERVIVRPELVEAILRAYVQRVDALGVLQVSEATTR